ncbi:Monodehydroascorbate reductase (NADH) [Bertholletia excelsa]
MAEVRMSNPCMFSPTCSIDNHRHGISLFPTESAKFASGLEFPSLQIIASFPFRSSSPSFRSEFHGRRIGVQGLEGIYRKGTIRSTSFSTSINAQMSVGIIGKGNKWWEKGLKPNMKEVKGAQDLLDSLLNAGDKLVVVDFFSPGCGGCRALHPKICQLAELNPDVQFLQVNYEEHKSMCYSLNVHVLPFFRFYRGADGRLCSFSCTNATIKKFKDALAKHSPERCSLGPPKGLEEKELYALASNKDLSFHYTPNQEQPVPATSQNEIVAERRLILASHPEREPSSPLPLPLPLTTASNSADDTRDKAMVALGR